jgi:hypothetical protein
LSSVEAASLREPHTASGTSAVVLLDSDGNVSRELVNAPPEALAGIVWEVSRFLPRWTQLIPPEVLRASQRVPLVLHVQPTSPLFSEVLSVTKDVPQLRLTWCGLGGLQAEIDSLVEPEPVPAAARRDEIRCSRKVR